MKTAHRYFLAAAVGLAGTLFAGASNAAEHVVHMLNKGEAGAMVFEPAYVKADVGDTVKFVPTDKGHNAESVAEAWPEGAEPLKGKMNEEITYKVEKEGLYVIKCLPHYGMGMVALVQAGKPVNLDKVKDFKALGKAKKRLSDELAKVTQ